MEIHQLLSLFNSVKSEQLYGRYVTNSHIEGCFSGLPDSCISVIGYSVERRPIYSITMGEGPNRILMWSQMHGNESTTTKALFDCFNLLLRDDNYFRTILKQCTLCVIPILNPDGAEKYTRFNANSVDLNRDAQNLSQPESRLLREVYENFNPDYCFNLHGQRSIFGAGHNGSVATLSFLSPSQDEERSLTPNRKKAMALISRIALELKDVLPHGIGRYDDGFNINCVGDTFQSLGTPTLLYEAGHFQEDYDREEVRRFVFLALVKGIEAIANSYEVDLFKSYFEIPNNVKNYRDLAITNAITAKDQVETLTIVFQFKEVLKRGKIEFKPVVESIFESTDLKFHKTINANGQLVRTIDNKEIQVGYENDFVLINNKKTALNP
ncbi:M14 metallopeptidase family protein [uncultured Winogradskyella sp.]|mgnify:CR=1 FL=1|uniref:M14 family metallopeptidase n=1 Tax=uncultured Winogradskyella sp. TaxID=395353 RepID=UPI003512C641